jgi:hypothetical protein
MTTTPDERPPLQAGDPIPERIPTPGETAPPILDEAQQQAAIQDEQNALDQAVQHAAQAHLQNRAVALNMEVRIRDQRIRDLEAENAELREALDSQAGLPGSGD